MPPIDPKEITRWQAVVIALDEKEQERANQLPKILSPEEFRTLLGNLYARSIPDGIASLRRFLADEVAW